MLALILGDIWPYDLEEGELSLRLGFASDTKPELVIWTLDAAIAGIHAWRNRTALTFPSELLQSLRLGNTNIVVGASNHVTDTGPEGVLRLCNVMRDQGFRYVGLGADATEAKQPLFISTCAGRVALLAAAETEAWVGAIAAGSGIPGVSAYQEGALIQSVAAARAEADHVWVYLHWGREFVRFPEPRQRRAARSLVDAGASLVVASHTHVPMGREQVGDAHIFYGLGNFLFRDMITESGYTYRWDNVSRSGLAIFGSACGKNWEWTPKAVTLDLNGVPTIGSIADASLCPDYGVGVHSDLRRYTRVYPWLRRVELVRYYLRRLMVMTSSERRFRLRQGIRALRQRNV